MMQRLSAAAPGSAQQRRAGFPGVQAHPGDNIRWLLVLILLLGATLRLSAVRAHGLDGDDAFSLNVAQHQTTLDLLRGFGQADEIDHHPKLHFLLLHLWIQVAGTSLVALRTLNIFPDLLLGALLIQSTRALFNQRVSLLVGLLWAVNPLLIWVTGLVRMYALLAVFGTLSWLFLLRALMTPRPTWWLAFVLAALGTAYSQVIGVIVLAAVGAVLLVWAVTRRQATGLLLLGGVGALYLPYLLQMWARRRSLTLLAQSPPGNPLEFIQQVSAGLLMNRPPIWEGWTWALTALALGLLFAAWFAGPRRVVRTLFLLLAVEVAGFALLAGGTGLFQTKFFAFIAPLFLLMLALGLEQLPHPAIRGAAVSALALAGLVGYGYQLAPTAWEDFPSAAQFIETHGDADDLVIVMSSYGGPPFRYHYSGASAVLAPWFGISADMPLDDLLTFNIQGHDTAWLVFYQESIFDPQALLDGWFRARFPLRTEVFPNRVTVRAYDLRPVTDALPPEATDLDAVFGGRLALRGYQLYVDEVSRRDNRLHPPSGWLHVTLYWEALEPHVAFAPRVTLEGEYGQVYGGELNRDSGLFGLHPPTTWESGQVWRSDTDLNLNPDMPTGEHKVVVRVYGPSGSGEPWPATGANAGGEWVIVDQVRVTP